MARISNNKNPKNKTGLKPILAVVAVIVVLALIRDNRNQSFVKRIATGELPGPLDLVDIQKAVATVLQQETQLADPILANSFKRTTGNGWKINPGPSVYPNYECRWLDFESTTGKKAKFCGHSDNDGVTQHIATKKRFHHCNVLPSMWASAPKKENSVYVEIGANIGSCVMEMLLSTDARVIAFEPHPKNQYVMQQSVAALPKEYQDRFVLVPVALGDSEATNTIFAAKGNMGNSVVGKIIKDNNKQEFQESDQHLIRVERLDSILSANAHVGFIKMDAQGFECRVLDGIGQELAGRIEKVKFEVAHNWLRGQGCGSLLTDFRSKGFKIYREDMRTVVEAGETNQFRGMVELVSARA